MIQGLIYFSIFTQDMSKKIDSCVVVFKSKGMCDQKDSWSKVLVLQDYSTFIKNNNHTLGATVQPVDGILPE